LDNREGYPYETHPPQACPAVFLLISIFAQGHLTMSKNQLLNFYEEIEDSDEGTSSNPKQMTRKRESKKTEADARLFVRAQEISREFKFTYKAARFEEAWLLESLVDIAEHQWISDVLRNLKNDQQYRAGRSDLDASGSVIHNDGDLHAMKKRTNYGEGLRHQSWIAYEFQTLEILHAAGADVSKPYAMEKNAILMGYVGDFSNAAPTLNFVTLDREEARPLFERVIRNVDLLLSNGRIHGDLSAYNILYWDGDITLIDFPQVVPPEANPSAWNIFLRDVTRICQYFHTQGVHVNGHKLASELWTSHGHKIVKEADPRYLDADDNNDRGVWEKQRSGR
jgi:serine/threonine-protein kinase RIO1